MTYSANAVANAFISLAKREGKALTNMQVQKLVYISQGFSLALLGRSLFKDDAHAWQWGPVIPKLYKALQKYGNKEVTELIENVSDPVPDNSDECALIKEVWGAYGEFSGAKLSALTHQEGTPWSLTWEQNRFGVIPLDVITEHYKDLVSA